MKAHPGLPLIWYLSFPRPLLSWGPLHLTPGSGSSLYNQTSGQWQRHHCSCRIRECVFPPKILLDLALRKSEDSLGYVSLYVHPSVQPQLSLASSLHLPPSPSSIQQFNLIQDLLALLPSMHFHTSLLLTHNPLGQTHYLFSGQFIILNEAPFTLAASKTG